MCQKQGLAAYFFQQRLLVVPVCLTEQGWQEVNPVYAVQTHAGALSDAMARAWRASSEWSKEQAPVHRVLLSMAGERSLASLRSKALYRTAYRHEAGMAIQRWRLSEDCTRYEPQGPPTELISGTSILVAAQHLLATLPDPLLAILC